MACARVGGVNAKNIYSGASPEGRYEKGRLFGKAQKNGGVGGRRLPPPARPAAARYGFCWK